MSPDPIRIRPYQSQDAEAVSQLIRSTMRISNSPDYPMEKLQLLMDYFSPTKIEEINQNRSCFVAIEADHIVGTAGLEDDNLVTFFVDPRHQRRGIGAALLQRVENAAELKGLQTLNVQSSLAGAQFYEAMGYRPTGRLVELFAGTHVEMHKTLTR